MSGQLGALVWFDYGQLDCGCEDPTRIMVGCSWGEVKETLVVCVKVRWGLVIAIMADRCCDGCARSRESVGIDIVVD